MIAHYGGPRVDLTNVETITFAPEVLHQKVQTLTSGDGWRPPFLTVDKEAASLVTETEGPNWWLWGGVAIAVGIVGYLSYRYVKSE